MFKRLDKRRRKKEEEENLGLDEEVKEILGIQDTDSEESESESDSNESQGEEPMSAADEEMDGEDEDEDEDEDPSITVSQALEDPLYIVSILPDVRACIVCPGKLLKSVKMVQLHRTSNAHIRRFRQFSDGSADAKANDSAWEILKRNSETKPKSLTSSGASKRAEKRKASQVRRKARRQEEKEKAKAKKSKPNSESTPTQPSDIPGSTKVNPPPKKKRKVDHGTGHQELLVEISTTSVPSVPPPIIKKPNKKESANTKHAPVTDSALAALERDGDARGSPNIQTSVKIQDIVKSTSNRAKTARSRALSTSKKHKSTP